MEIITSWENERIKYNKEKRLKKEYIEERVGQYNKIKGRIVLVYRENRIEFKTKDIEGRFSKIIDDLLRG